MAYIGWRRLKNNEWNLFNLVNMSNMSVFYLYTLCRAPAAAKQLAVNRREGFPSSPNNSLNTWPNKEPQLLHDLKSTCSVLRVKNLNLCPSLHNESVVNK